MLMVMKQRNDMSRLLFQIEHSGIPVKDYLERDKATKSARWSLTRSVVKKRRRYREASRRLNFQDEGADWIQGEEKGDVSMMPFKFLSGEKNGLWTHSTKECSQEEEEVS